MVILDNDHELHVIDCFKKVNKIKMEGQKKIIQLKWVTQDKFMLLSLSGKGIIYDDKL